MLARVSLLSLRRHLRRTILVIMAVAAGAFVMELTAGLLEGMRSSFFGATLRDSGHVQVHTQGWGDRLNPYDLALLLDDPQAIVSFSQQKENVIAAGPLLHFGALVVAGETNLTMAGLGVPPDTEFVNGALDNVIEGRAEIPSDGLLISQSVAQLLDVEVGDLVAVLVEDSTGAPYYLDYPVTGLFVSPSQEFDDFRFIIDLTAAQDLVYVGSSASEVRLRLDDPQIAQAFAVTLRAAFPAAEVSTWQEIHGSYVMIFDLMGLFIWFVYLLVVVVAATVITNAILMNVLEKRQEFGTLRAIGLKRRGQFGMVMLEGLLQGAFGVVAGLVLGIPLVLYLAKNGIELGSAGEDIGLGRSVAFEYRPLSTIRTIGFGLLIPLAGSLYAAIVGSHRSIVSSLQTHHG